MCIHMTGVLELTLDRLAATHFLVVAVHMKTVLLLSMLFIVQFLATKQLPPQKRHYTSATASGPV